jgi:hypothetical protein
VDSRDEKRTIEEDVVNRAASPRWRYEKVDLVSLVHLASKLLEISFLQDKCDLCQNKCTPTCQVTVAIPSHTALLAHKTVRHQPIIELQLVCDCVTYAIFVSDEFIQTSHFSSLARIATIIHSPNNASASRNVPVAKMQFDSLGVWINLDDLGRLPLARNVKDGTQ